MENRRQRATAIILQDQKVLLIRRIKPSQDYYTFPGGGVDDGESIEEALVKEVKEELSLDVKQYQFLFSIENLVIPSYITIHKGNRDEHYFLVVKYTGIPEIGGPEKARMNEQNQYHIVWVGMKDMKDMENIYPREGVRKLLDFLQDRQTS